MKKIYIILIGLLMCLTLSSCIFDAYPTTQDDIYIETEVNIVKSEVDYQIVIQYGIPCYYNDIIVYYIYDNLYYYPYYYDNYWYFRCYRRPFPYIYYRPYFRPHRYDYRFREGYIHPRCWYRYDTRNRYYRNDHINSNNFNRQYYNNGNNRPSGNYRNNNFNTVSSGGFRGGSSGGFRGSSSGGFRGGRGR